MFRVSRSLFAAATAVAITCVATADTYTLTTLNIQNDTPEMNRPVPNGTSAPVALFGTNVPYDSQEFYSTVGGTVNINLNAVPYPGLALMIFVYADVFDPAVPLTNCIQGFGDSGGAATRSLSFTASAHRRYILVVTPYQSTRGTATGTIESVSGLVVPIRSREATLVGGNIFATTFNRPIANGNSPPVTLSAIGTNSPYNVRRVNVSSTGRYTFFADFTDANDAFTDGYICVYSGSFVPTSALSNCLACSDTLSSDRFAGVSLNLAAGDYYIVTTTFETGTLFGSPPFQYYVMPAHSAQITGPGRIEPGPFCPADFNNSGAVSVQDVFDFLAKFFSACP